MMLQQRALIRPVATTPSVKRHVRPVRAVETEATPTAAPSDEKLQSTLSTLDSLLPAEPQQQAPAASSSQPSSSPASSSAAKISANSSSLWPQLPTATAGTSPSRAAPTSKQQQSLDTVMGFDGLAPELINGRAAMLGFVAALIAETHGDSLFSQLMAGGFSAASTVILLVTLASFAPAVRQIPFEKVFGKDKTPASFGPFTPTAEMINGRAAMLGLLALFIIEGTAGQPFFL